MKDAEVITKLCVTLSLCRRFRNALLSLLGIDFSAMFPRNNNNTNGSPNGNGNVETEETRMMSTTTTTRVSTVIREED